MYGKEAVCVADTLTCCEKYGMPFSAWDLRLYLDTHPDDSAALDAFAQMYAHCGGDAYPFRGIRPCDIENGTFGYLCGPWPWEPDANCKMGTSECMNTRGGR